MPFPLSEGKGNHTPRRPVLLRAIIIGTLVFVAGCGKTYVEVTAVDRSEIASTLQQISKTGNAEGVLDELTVGLEREGFMQEAAQLQIAASKDDSEGLKRVASRLAKKVEKKLAASNSE